MRINSNDFRQWFKYNLEDYAEDIASHGCGGGFPYLTYYTDTCKIYDKFSSEIWDELTQDADDFGYDNVYDFMKTFNKDFQPYNETQMKNQLVWYMAEKVARELSDQ